MNASRRVSVFVAIFSMIFLCFSAPSFAESKKIIKWNATTTYAMAEGSVTDHIRNWIKGIEKLTNGRMQITLHPAKTFCGPEDFISALGNGVFDVGVTYAGFHIGTVPEAEVEIGLPMGWLDHNECYEMFYERGMIDILREAYAEHNVHFAAPGYSGQYYHFGTNFPVNSLDDLKGKKIRALGAYGKYAGAIGASPTVIPGPELYQAMRLGTIDGFIYDISGMKTDKLCEVTEYYVFPTCGIPVCGIYISMDSLNKLPEDLRVIVKEGSEYIMEQAARHYHRNVEKAWVYAQTHGKKMKRQDLSLEEIKKATDKSQPIWDEVAKRNPRNAEMVKRLREMLDYYGRLEK